MRLTTRSCRTMLGIFIAIAVLGSAASAQNWQGGLGFQLGFPTGEYKDQIDKTGVGLGGDILFSPRRVPLGIGLSLGWFQVGSESREEPFSTTIPDVTVDVETENALAQFVVLLRAQPKQGVIRPYADGVLGLNYLYTRTSIKNASGGEEVASSTNLDDAAFAYGVGGGAMVRVYDRKKSAHSRPMQVFIDVNFRYVVGGEAEYLQEGSIRREASEVSFDISKSKTNIATARIGVVVNF